MADPARARRLAKRISTIVASAIEFEIKDPRLTGVTITDAKVTGDLHDATQGREIAEDPVEDRLDRVQVEQRLVDVEDDDWSLGHGKPLRKLRWPRGINISPFFPFQERVLTAWHDRSATGKTVTLSKYQLPLSN